MVAELKGDLAAAIGREGDLQAQLSEDAQAMAAETSARQAAERAVQQVQYCDQLPAHSLCCRAVCRQHTHGCTRLPRPWFALSARAAVQPSNAIVRTAKRRADSSLAIRHSKLAVSNVRVPQECCRTM